MKLFISILFLLCVICPVALSVDRGAAKVIRCKDYNGKIVAYFSDVYRVKDCTLIPIESELELMNIQRQGQNIVEIDRDVVASMKLDTTEKTKNEPKIAKGHDCRSLNGKYITYTLNEIYYVENCKKRLLQDWDNYIEHSQKTTLSNSRITELSWEEYNAIEEGIPLSSATDKYLTKKITEEGKEIVLVSQQEACRGLEGRYISFAANLYKIESCKRRLIEDEKLTAKLSNQLGLIELESWRFASLPEGKPILAPADKRDLELD